MLLLLLLLRCNGALRYEYSYPSCSITPQQQQQQSSSLVVVGDYRGDFCLLLQFPFLSLSLPSAADEQMNGNLIWPEDLFTTLVAQSSMLKQHNFAPVATSDLTVCITVLSHSLFLSLSLSLSLSRSLALPHPPRSLRVASFHMIHDRSSTIIEIIHDTL